MAEHFDELSLLNLVDEKPSSSHAPESTGTRFRTEGLRFREPAPVGGHFADLAAVGAPASVQPVSHFRDDHGAEPSVGVPATFGAHLVPEPKLNAADERWLARMLDAFDAAELDIALRGSDPVEVDADFDVVDEVLDDPWANPELHEWTEQPVLERLHPGRRRRSPRRMQLVQSGMNVFVAIALTYVTVQGDPSTQVRVDAELATGAERTTDVAASRSDVSFVSTPTPIQLTAAQTPTTTTPPPPPPPPVTEAPKPTKAMVDPLPGAKLTSSFGRRTSPAAGASNNHKGIDLAKPSGTPIVAAAAGKVVKAGTESGYGRYTCIEHDGGLTSCYGHQATIEVKVGQAVDRGQRIGTVGSSGVSTGPHLHFEVKKNGAFVNPVGFY